MQKFSQDFIRLLENIHSIRDRVIWSPLCADDTEEALYSELCIYIKEYEHNIQNPCPVGDKTDIPKCPDIGFKRTLSLVED